MIIYGQKLLQRGNKKKFKMWNSNWYCDNVNFKLFLKSKIVYEIQDVAENFFSKPYTCHQVRSHDYVPFYLTDEQENQGQ